MLVNIVYQLGWSQTQCFSEQQFILSTKLVNPSKALHLCNIGRPHPVKVFENNLRPLEERRNSTAR